MATHVVTFADSAMSHMHRRFKRQARGLKVFDKVNCWTEHDLDQSFRRDFATKLRRDVNGYGYFVWKPQVILQALRISEMGDVLLYVDSGSHLVSTGRDRFLEYVEIVKKSKSGILAFELTFPEKQWTKNDLMVHLGVSDNPEIRDTPQVQAGAIFVHNRPEVMGFFEDWLNVFRYRFDLVDDTDSQTPNDESFVAHRHDQSVFSLLAKAREVDVLSALEQYPPGDPPDWQSLIAYPIHHRRDKRTITRKVAARMRDFRRPWEVLLVRAKRALITWLRSFR